VQDGDRMRRGRETVWHRFGTPQAINLGDAMFYYTLLLIQRLDVPIARREAAARRVLQETLRVIDGQEREFALRRCARPRLDEYFVMVEAKTSGLFALPIAGAAAICGQPPQTVQGLQEAARHLGVLFQIQDDVLDLYGDKGRGMRGNDIREGKRSMMVVHALQSASAADAARLSAILEKDRDATSTEEVEEALQIFSRTGSLEYALEEVTQRRRRALDVPALDAHPHLLSVIEAMCDLFLEPIEPVISPGGGQGGGSGTSRRRPPKVSARCATDETRV
jgi:geranylgeranyl diphosphate synthase, type I